MGNGEAEEPPTIDLQPITESSEFRAETEVILQPHAERDGAGQGMIAIVIRSLTQEELRNVKTVIYYPDEMVEMMLIPESSLRIPFSRNPLHIGPLMPSFEIRQRFEFPDWDQVEKVREAVLNPIRLWIVWDQGERYLEIPASEIKVTQLPDDVPSTAEPPSH